MGQFQKVAQQYSTKWNFPNCIGAIDGKHIRIKAPKNSGSLFYNYKDYHSMVMLAVVDADCKFTAVDVGSYGREGDAGIFLKSEIGRRIKNIIHSTYHHQKHYLEQTLLYLMSLLGMKPLRYIKI
ncbi:DDE Tnp4 domain-containing protein [Trichonephila clavipes]|nr:DDE Tnp4 domain-containing protein [Trichonephila clavipes]